MKTVSLDLAKQLKANRFPQDSYFWWEAYGSDKGKLLTENRIPTTTETDKKPYVSCKSPSAWQYAAPTAEEILERLGPGYHVSILKQGHDFETNKDFIEYICTSPYPETSGLEAGHVNFKGETAAEALGRMWLLLKRK